MCSSDLFAGVRHIIKNKLEGCLHPGKLCQALHALVQSMGVTVLSGLEITHHERCSDGILLYTDKGIRLCGKQALVCTNGFAGQLFPELQVAPARGQVLVTGPIPGLRIKGAFHFDEGYYYFRNLGNRVLLGGARNLAIAGETTTEMELSATVQNALESFLSTCLLPGLKYEITDRWSGIMGFGPERMPVIKNIAPDIFCAAGLSGMGVALAPVLGEKIAGMMQ